ncbi:MAG: HAD family hydrolase [Anaerolineae bacterium]|nr:HAD family hydrolase [Anaerolineae bacterium]
MTKTAFFDLDYTLLNISSGLTYVKESFKQGRAPLWVIGYIALSYQFRWLDFGQAHGRLITYVARHGRAEVSRFFDELVTNRILPHLTPAGRAKIEWHTGQGHRVVIISASIEELVKPVAQALGLGGDYLCTHLSVKDGSYTGELDGPLCYGPGKIHWAKEWATRNGLDFPETVGYFYTDSSSDLPLLEMADHPIAVNPSRKLAKIARARGWPIERFY